MTRSRHDAQTRTDSLGWNYEAREFVEANAEEPLPALTNDPGPTRIPDRYQEAIASRFAAGDTMRELADDYNMREDLVARAIRVTLGYLLEQHPKLEAENAKLRERLEAIHAAIPASG